MQYRSLTLMLYCILSSYRPALKPV